MSNLNYKNCQFCLDSDEIPSCPLRPENESHSKWHIWRAILDRIISHPQYRYGAPNVKILLKLARFAGIQMALYNNRQWGTHSDGVCYTGEFDGHVSCNGHTYVRNSFAREFNAIARV